ncbi:WG repeat-containing protein [Flavisolibacter sp. BT320]|nr:WG repeat-containing protein [Flavisolibacter longurius]
MSETINNVETYYYLLKDGRKVARDSVYMVDFTFDCESEEKIIFKDWKKDRMGFLNKDGRPIIPAKYNYVTPFRNGMAIALQNARRQCADRTKDTTNCEHLSWTGGERILINEKDDVLVDSLENDLYSVDWYSKRINDAFVDTSLFITLQGRNNTSFSFVDFDKEFKKWFTNYFLPAAGASRDSLLPFLFDEITFWTDADGWVALEKNAFLRTYPGALALATFDTRRHREISINSQLFNDMIYNKPLYKKYMNACGQPNSDRFPMYNVLLTTYKKTQQTVAADTASYEIDFQESFAFLRTENGYRLISVTLPK